MCCHDGPHVTGRPSRMHLPKRGPLRKSVDQGQRRNLGGGDHGSAGSNPPGKSQRDSHRCSYGADPVGSQKNWPGHGLGLQRWRCLCLHIGISMLAKRQWFQTTDRHSLDHSFRLSHWCLSCWQDCHALSCILGHHCASRRVLHQGMLPEP